MSDEFRRLVEQARVLAYPIGGPRAVTGVDDPNYDSDWHVKAADAFHVTATGNLRAARIVADGDEVRPTRVRVQKTSGVFPASLEKLIDRFANKLTGKNKAGGVGRVSAVISMAREQAARAFVSDALMFTSHIASYRARGFNDVADDLEAAAPQALNDSDWSDADAICSAPWRFVGWLDDSTPPEIFYRWVSRTVIDECGFSGDELLCAFALILATEAAASDDPERTAFLWADASAIFSDAGFHEGWEAAEQSRAHEGGTAQPDAAMRQVISERARKAALARHRPHHAEMEQAKAYFREHSGKFPSLKAVARAFMSDRELKVDFETVYRWMIDCNKPSPRDRS